MENNLSYRDKAYVAVLNDRINKLQHRLSVIRRNSSTKEVNILKLENEIKKIKEELEVYNKTNKNKYSTSFSAEFLELLENRKDKQITTIQEKITHLKEQREQLNTKWGKHLIDRKISKMQSKQKKLETKQAKLQGIQKFMIKSKRSLLNHKYANLSKEEAKVEYYTALEKDYKVLRDNLDLQQEGFQGIKNSITNVIYGFKQNRIMKKKEKHQEILEHMKNNDSTLTGARVMTISKKILDKYRMISNNYKTPAQAHTM